MKFSFSLLLALSSMAPALAQNNSLPQGPGTNPMITIPLGRGGGGVQFGSGQRNSGSTFDIRPRDYTPTAQEPCTPVYGPTARPCVNGVTTPAAPRRDIQCTVNFTGLDVQNYTSGGRTMKRLVISGKHNAPEGSLAEHNFSVTDSDGFLTLAALHAHWQTNRSGVIRINSGYPAAAVSVPAAELRLAREAAEMGLAYYRRLIEIVSVEPRPSNYDVAIETSNAKIEVLQKIATEVAQWETNQNGVPARRISAVISEPLERFGSRIGEDVLMSQYRDAAFGDRPQLFCNREAESDFVGIVMCNTNFVDGQIRDTTFCGGGITFGETGLAGLRMGTLAPPGIAAPAAGQR